MGYDWYKICYVIKIVSPLDWVTMGYYRVKMCHVINKSIMSCHYKVNEIIVISVGLLSKMIRRLGLVVKISWIVIIRTCEN